MARPPNLSGAWGTDWNRAAAMMPAYGMYPTQQYHPYMALSTDVTASALNTVNAAVAVAVKRPRTEVEEATSGASSKDHHILWMRAYDKPMPDFLKSKCKPLYCEVCSVNLNSIIQAKMHYEGKGHEKKIRLGLQTWAKENNTVPPKKISISSQSTIDAATAAAAGDIYGPSPAQRARFDYSYTSHARDLYCGPCDTSFTSHAHAQQHLSGRNHKRVVTGLAPLKAGYFNTRTGKWQRQPPQDGDETNIAATEEQVFNHHPVPPGLPPPPPPPPPLPGPEAEEPVQSVQAVVSGEGSKFFCNVCGVNATSQAQLDMHLNGRTHKTRCAKTGVQSYDQQYAVMSGTNALPMIVPKIENETKSKPKKDYSIYRTPSGQFYCALCNLCVNSEQQFVQHIASRKHKLKESSAKGKKTKSKK